MWVQFWICEESCCPWTLSLQSPPFLGSTHLGDSALFHTHRSQTCIERSPVDK